MALRYWNMARQRYCGRLARYTRSVSADPVAKPAAHTRAESRVLDFRNRMRERDGLSAGGRRIRALGPSSLKGGSLARAEIQKSRTRNLPKRCCQGDRGFKPRSGHRRVRCEPDFFARRTPDSLNKNSSSERNQGATFTLAKNRTERSRSADADVIGQTQTVEGSCRNALIKKLAFRLGGTMDDPGD